MQEDTPPPEKLSDLLDLAIADARRLDRSRYAPNFTVWHQPRPDGKTCMVCLGGAVIAGTLRQPPNLNVEPCSTSTRDPDVSGIDDHRWRRTLWTLDAARAGKWTDAFRLLHGHEAEVELRQKLEAIPEPVGTEFEGWRRLDAHLASLADRASRLRENGM